LVKTKTCNKNYDDDDDDDDGDGVSDGGKYTVVMDLCIVVLCL
jgi:hypothetical protein